MAAIDRANLGLRLPLNPAALSRLRLARERCAGADAATGQRRTSDAGGHQQGEPLRHGPPGGGADSPGLVADDAPHVLEIELRGRMLTPQVDQLVFSLPAGARLAIAEIEFRGDPQTLPCETSPPLPNGTTMLAARGPLSCAGSPATSLRGRESIGIDGGGRKGRTLYLSLMAHLAGQVKESSETAQVVARVKYADRFEEEQFPLLAAERRYALLDRKPALYALALDGQRALASVELLDRSPHAQLVLFAAGLSEATPPEPRQAPWPPVSPVAQASGLRSGEANLEGSKWFRFEATKGKTLPPEALRPDLRITEESNGRALSLALTNVGATPLEFVLVFPSLQVRPAEDPSDVYYLFPQQGAVISRRDMVLENVYSGAFPLQFLDVFSPKANRCACLIVRDTEGQFKTFRLKKSGVSVEVEVEYTLRLAPGETYRPPEVSVSLHGGDWREGFNAYRKWLRSWYKPAGPRPVWLRSAFWARRDYPVGGSGRLFDVRRNRYTFDELIRDGEAFGGIDFIDISGWGLSDSVGRVGDYPVELGGPADLRRNIAFAKASGIPTGLYFEGYLIDKNSAVGRRLGRAGS